MLEAIKGVAEMSHLHVEKGLPDAIADDILHDSASNIALLLQILLRKMWNPALFQKLEKRHSPHIRPISLMRSAKSL